MSYVVDAPASSLTVDAARRTAGPSPSIPSPRTPQNTPPGSANRRLVRPLLQQQRKNIIQHQHHQQQQQQQKGNGGFSASSDAAVSPRAVSVSGRYPADASVTVLHGAAPAPSSPTPEAASPSPVSVEESADVKQASEGPATAPAPRYPENVDDGDADDDGGDGARVDLGSIPVVHCPPIRTPASGVQLLRATQPHMKRAKAPRPGPLVLPRAETTLSLASYPSNLSTDLRATSSVSSSFVGLSSTPQQGAVMSSPAEAAQAGVGSNTNTNSCERQLVDVVTGPKLSSPSSALSGRSGYASGRGPAPPPLLLRTSLSAHALPYAHADDATPSSTSSTLHRLHAQNSASVGGGTPAASFSPRLRMGLQQPALTIPSSTASVASGAATPLSISNRSSTRPSFLRVVAPVSSTSPVDNTANPTSLPAYVLSGREEDGAVVSGAPGSQSVSRSEAARSSLTATKSTVNGRVLASPLGARRPELGVRRTTFTRTSSTRSLPEAAPALAASRAEPDVALGIDGAGANGARDSQSRGEPPLNKEMRSFVLGQYRTLQREVVPLPTKAATATAAATNAATTAAGQTDITAADFQHVKRISCPRHSKAAKLAEEARREAERLRALQQQHHDMAVIRNGGREQVAENMKSSTMLAGSLSKLRSRHKPSSMSSLTATAFGGGVVDRVHSSLDQTISSAFDMEESPFGSPEEVEGTVLYGGTPYSSRSPEKPLQVLAFTASSSGNGVEAQNAKDDDAVSAAFAAPVAEAWHSSRYFMPAATSSQQDRRLGRSVNKNGMKGEAIVVAVMPDSDDDDEDDSAQSGGEGTAWRSRLTRTKGVGSFADRTNTAAAAAALSVSTSFVSADAETARRAGERLPRHDDDDGRLSHPVSALSSNKTNAKSGNLVRHANSSSSSDDDDACFSFNKLRSQRVRSSVSLSSSQTLPAKPAATPQTLATSPDRVKPRAQKLKVPLSEDSSDSDEVNNKSRGEDEEDVDACCSCCPCKRPENFFALCRAGSRSGSFVADEAPGNATAAGGGSSNDAPRAEQSDTVLSADKEAAADAQRSPPKPPARVRESSPVVLEDLEDSNDDEEPLLSMQSFRRASIQRVR